MVFGIDQFAAIAAQHGELGSDAALKELAARLRQLSRRNELIGRYGDDEFAAVLPETDLAGAVVYAERACRGVADIPLELEGQPFPVTLSAGVEELSAAADMAADALLRKAKRGQTEAVKAGGNQVALAVPLDGTGVHRSGDPAVDPTDVQTIPSRGPKR